MINWDEFDSKVDLDNLQKDVENSTSGEYEELPEGNYEVEVSSLELGESKKGDPMVKLAFRVINGEYQNRLIFVNQVVVQGFQIHTINEILRGLETGLEITFRSYSDYNKLLLQVAEKTVGAEYELELGKNKKGYATYKILRRFETPNVAETEFENNDNPLGW